MSNSEFDPAYVFKHHPVTPDKVARFDQFTKPLNISPK